jgi:F0F1-type ATP synthase membrane subunit c/vacuolar-type H+-ATPase subunit K
MDANAAKLIGAGLAMLGMIGPGMALTEALGILAFVIAIMLVTR